MVIRHDLDAMRKQHPIVEILERLGSMPPAPWNGSSDFMISCPSPTHDDHTPSCIVHPAADRLHCFGCGLHGDVFDLVQQVVGVRSLGEAIAYLGGGAPLSGTSSGALRSARPAVIDTNRPVLERTSVDRILEVNSAAWLELTTPTAGAIARSYLAGRGIDVAPLERREGRPLVGYTPAQPTGLTERLRTCGFTETEVIDAGWTIRGEDQIYDRFRRRVVFPIRDEDGHHLGVTARDITGSARAKYINTPTTAAFRKGDRLYVPLDPSSPAVCPVVVCEGPIDALAVAVHGVAAGSPCISLAMCGTAMTNRHAELIARLGTNGVAVYADGDSAGRDAARRWVQTLRTVGTTARLEFVPDAQDPASWLSDRSTGRAHSDPIVDL